MKKFLLLVPLLYIGFCSYAQLSSSDLLAITKQDFDHPAKFSQQGDAYNNGQFMKTRKKTFISHYNPLTLGMGAVMYSYQHVISPLLSRSCPYQISCSNFAKLSIREWGPFKGVFISADRILRCNRLSLLNISPLKINPKTGKILDEPSWYQ
jgi:uncharacterized protein